MKPPPRLLDDPALAPELRTDLERSVATKPAYDVGAGLTSLQAAIIASAAAAASAPSSAAAAHASSAGTTAAAKAASTGVWGTLATKVTVASLVTAAAVTTTVIAWPAPHREPAAAPRATAHAPATSHAPASITPPSPAPTPAPSAPAPDTAPAADSADVLVRLPDRVPTYEPIVAPSPSASDTAPALRGGASFLRREINQLARIKSMAETDPARAYRLARQGGRDFPRGVLGQEREALAIVALVNDNRRPEAARQLRAFVARYPHSPARERLEQLLGAAGE